MKIKMAMTAMSMVLAMGNPAQATTSGKAAASQTLQAKHVLLISVDGMHHADLARFVAGHPASALAELSRHAVSYSQAYTPIPSDSFPGLIALLTGATPRSSGVYYDDSYDRTLSAAGSDCSQRGAEVVYDGSIDRNNKQLDGGGAIDPAKLPRNPARGCAPVYPHDYLRVNTVFEVIKQAGGHTAWSDKHLSYDFVQGPSGHGVDDLYTPEIAAAGEKLASFPAYDELKVNAVIKQISGWNSNGSQHAAVPALFGMNFQNLSVAQKSGDGYRDANATPGEAIAGALGNIDHSLQRIVVALKTNKLYDSTLIVLTAKHGQSPIDPTLLKRIDGKQVIAAANSVAPDLVAKDVTDDVGLLWLKDQGKTAAVAAALNARADELGIAKVYAGSDMPAGFADPAQDARAPDIAIEVKPGVVYTHGKKMAEHGGFGETDRHVALLLAQPGLKAMQVDSPVSTTQVAPSLLATLGLDPARLSAVNAEHTATLPGLKFKR